MTVQEFKETNEMKEYNRPEISLKECKKSILFNIQLEETIDADRVKLLLNSSLVNTEKPEWMEESTSFFPFESEKKQLEKLYKKLRKNTNVVKYMPAYYKAGRVYGENSLCYVGLRRALRHALAYDKYVDIDIENAHPTMLYQLCGEECKMEVLYDYIKNRQNYFNDLTKIYELKDTVNEKGVMETVRDTCKSYMTALTYGAGFSQLNKIVKRDDIPAPKWVDDYKKEMKRASSYIINCNAWLKEITEKDTTKTRNDNCLLSIYLQEHERRVLETVYKLFIKKGIFNEKIRNNGSLCYDGIMILKSCYNDDLLKEISEEVYNVNGFRLNYTTKDMTKDNAFIKYQENPTLYNLSVTSSDDNADVLNEDQTKEEWYINKRMLFEYGKEEVSENDKPIRFKCDDFFVEINKNGDLDYKNEKQFRAKYRDFHTAHQGKKKYNFIDLWFDDPDKVKYNKMVFNPDYETTNENEYNLYEGLEVEKNTEEINDEDIDELVKPILDLLYYLCGESDRNREYLLKILSAVVQLKDVNDKPAIMVVFRDIAGVLDTAFGGTGKDTFLAQFFSRFIIGNKYAYECSSTDDLTEKFNGVLANKIIVNIPELSSALTQNSKWSKIKNYITAPTINIEVKGVNKTVLKNYMTLFASTNEDINFGIDRRLWVVDVSRKKKYDTEYWKNLYDKVLPDTRVQKAFHLYLTKKIQPYSGATEYQMNKPDTVAMNEQKVNKKSLIQVFFEDMSQSNLFKPTKDGEVTISTVDLLTYYKEWCSKNNYKCEISSNGFGQQLTRLCLELSSLNLPLFMGKSKNHSIRGYTINHSKLREWNAKLNGCQIREEEKTDESDNVTLDERNKIIEEIKELIETCKIRPSKVLENMIKQLKRDNDIDDLDLN